MPIPDAKSAPSHVVRRLLFSAGAAALFLLAACDDKAASSAAASRPPAKVVVAEATTGSVPLFLEVIGTTSAVNQVEVRARVDGVIQQRLFTEGDDVKQGDALYVIDQRPFQAALDQSKAELTQNQANLDFANKEVKRYEPLAARSDVSQERLQEVQSTAQQAAAATAASQAKVKGDQLNLEYTTVIAPLDGRVGRAVYDVGNLITAQETLLTNMVQMDPIYVYFSPSETDYLNLEKYRAKAETAQNTLPVTMTLADGNEHETAGKLDYVDPQVDFATGTIPLRAVFDNPDFALRPGQYAKVKVELEVQQDLVLVPAEAIGRTQAGPFVLVVDKDNKVEQRDVTIGRLYQGHQIIEKGVKPGEKVITKGLQKARPGSTVSPQVAEATKSSG
ncbi:MAG: efflux RND transporter periplasmic adaptor subunit [Pseudomonadota bacterium]